MTSPVERALRLNICAAGLLTTVGLIAVGLSGASDLPTLLRGPDDAMRMVRVVDWLDGQAWGDPVQYRLNPPEGVSLPWSRLADLPVAGIVAATQEWVGRENALRLAALIAPAMLGGAFVGLFFWVVAAVSLQRHALVPFTSASALLLPLTQLMPGRIDHHGLQLVLVVLAIGFLVRSMRHRRWQSAVGVGVVAGCSLAVGLETLPFLMATTVAFGLAWVVRSDMAVPFAAFGLAWMTTALLLLPLTVPPTEWVADVCDRMTLVHVAATVAVAVTASVGLALARVQPGTGWTLRLLTGGATATAGLLVLATAFPDCVGGPYAGLSPDVRYWFDSVREAQSLLELFDRKPGTAIAFASLPVIALGICAARLPRAIRERDLASIAMFVLGLSGLAVMTWQIRGTYGAVLVAAVLLTRLAETIHRRAGRIDRSILRFFLRLGFSVLCAAVIVCPLLIQRMVSGPVSHTESTELHCDLDEVLPALNDADGLGASRQTIAAPIDLGPQILLLTRHAVLAAPYHRNVEGLVANRRIFAGVEAEALVAIAANDVDAVVFCPKFAGLGGETDHEGSLDDRLAVSKPPAWLVPVQQTPGISLYRVDPLAGDRTL